MLQRRSHSILSPLMSNGSALLLVLLVAMLAVSAPGLQAQGTLLQSTEYQVTSDANGHSTPVIGHDSIGDYIVYTQYPIVDGVAGNSDIYYQRVADGQPTGSPVVVANSGQNQYLNDAFGDYIVFTRAPAVGMVGNIILFQISTGLSRPLTSTGDCLSPRIYGNYVIWLEQLASGTQILLYDVTTGVPVQTTLMAGPAPSIGDAAIGDRFIVWSQLVNEQYDVAAYDMQKGLSESVSANANLNEKNVATSGAWITFETSSGSIPAGISIEAINMDTGATLTVANNGSNNQRPNISGDLLSYESNVLGYFQIFIFRLAEGDTFQATSSTYDERLNEIKDNLVTYVDDRTGNYNVFASSLAFVFNGPAVTAASPVNFGSVNVGANSTQSVVLSINKDVTLSSVQASGDFAVSSNTCALNTALAANTTCTLQVQFTPTKPGQRWFPLVVSDSSSKSYRFGLEGVGVAPVASFTPGIMSTVAGGAIEGFSGDNGQAINAELRTPSGVAVDNAGNLYVADGANQRIRRVDQYGYITTVAGNGVNSFTGDGGPAISASLSLPNGVAVDSAGNLYIADSQNNRIRKVDASTGKISTVAGSGGSSLGDGGPAIDAALNFPTGMAFDTAGNLYIADDFHGRIRKVDTSGIITTVAGNGTNTFNGDGILATSASLFDSFGVAVDGAGNIYIADQFHQRIRKVDTSGIITTVAGNGNAGYSGDMGQATAAELNYPTGVALDAAGNLYIADNLNYCIRKVDTNGIITTVAGNGNAGYSGDNGPATSAQFNGPESVAADNLGDLYIGDLNNYRVRKVDVTTSELTYGTLNVGQSSSPQALVMSNAGNAPLVFSSALSTDNQFLFQTADNDCRAPSASPLAVGANCTFSIAFAPTVPGNPSIGALSVMYSPAPLPQLVGLTGIATTPPVSTGITLSASPESPVYGEDVTLTAMVSASQFNNAAPTGTVFFADETKPLGQVPLTLVGSSMQATLTFSGNQLFLVGPNNILASYTGDANYTGSSNLLSLSVTAYGNAALISGVSGYEQATTVQTAFAGPLGVKVTDLYNNPVPGVTVTFTAPTSGSSATLSSATAITDSNGQASVTATANAIAGSYTVSASIGSVSEDFTLTNLTGTAQSFGTVALGATSTITLSYPQTRGARNFAVHYGIEFTAGTPDCTILKSLDPSCSVVVTFQPKYPGIRSDFMVVTDSFGNVVQTTQLSGIGLGSAAALTPGIISTVAGNGTECDYSTSSCGDNGPATGAEFYGPAGLAMDMAGNLYIVDTFNNRIRKIDATTHNISTTAGGGTSGQSGDGGPATSAELFGPFGVAVDGAGNLYITDGGTCSVRKVDGVSGNISAVAGTCPYGFSGDGGPATLAEFHSPTGVAVDSAGNFYIADSGNNRIRKVDTNGIITTVAGNGTAGYRSSDDGGLAINAELSSPYGVAVDSAGNFYIADTSNNRIRKVDSNGMITTVAGNGLARYFPSDDGRPAILAALHSPTGVALDSAGNFYIADSGNNGIRKVDTSGIITTVAGVGPLGTPGLGDGGAATSAYINGAGGVALDGKGNLYIADVGNARIRKVDVSVSALSLGSVNLGLTSVVQQLGLSNVGNAPLNFDPSNAPNISAEFQLQNDNCTTQGSLGAGGTCYFGIVFAPTTAGNPVSGTLILTDDSLNAPQVFNATQTVQLGAIATAYPPLFMAPPPAPPNVVVEATSPQGALATFTVTARTWNGGDATVVCTPGSGGTFPLGATQVSCTATDPASSSLTTTRQFYVDVRDTTPPALQLPTPITATATGASGATVNYTVTATDLADPSPTVICKPASGATFPVGTTTVNCTGTDHVVTDAIAGNSGGNQASGAFTVTVKAPLVITWATPAPITYGTALGGMQLNATASVAGMFTYNPPAGTVLGAGNQTLTATFTPTDGTDYTAATATVTLTVNKATPAITWAAPAAITYGTVLGGVQLNATASVAGTFVYSPPAGTVLGAGSHILSVTFSPTDTVDYSAVAAQVTLQVNQATPVIAWMPASIQLGYTLGGAQLDATASVPGTFTYTPPLGTVIMTTSRTLSALFTPTDSTDYTTARMSVPLTVTPGPLASVSPSNIDFGTVYLGSITIKNVTVTNLGNAPMTISDPFLSIVSGGNSNEFVMVNLCPKPLAAEKSCTIAVSFIAGPFYNPQTATIQVKDNAPGSPQTVVLTATVINPQANFRPGSLSFGTQAVNSSTTKTVTLTNTGATALSITNIAITGTNAADFTQANACPSSLVAGASCTISVTFRPVSKNAFSAGLTVTDNMSSGKQTVTLTGTGQ